jgi:DNA repair protein RAD5
MDDVDAFLASLDRFTSPTIDAGIQRQQTQLVSSQGPAAAAQQATDTTAGPLHASRRRPRGGEIQYEHQQQQQQQQRPQEGQKVPLPSQRQYATSRAPDSLTHADVNGVSLVYNVDAAQHHEPAHLWRCLRCSTENVEANPSCCGCHSRRRRVEEPRPNAGVTDARLQASSSPTSLNQHVSAVVDGEGGSSYFVGREPVVVAGQSEVSCPRCTFLNPSHRRTCEMCEGLMPSPASAAVVPSMMSGVGANVEHNALRGATAVLAPSAAASAAVPSLALPGVGGGGVNATRATDGSTPSNSLHSVPATSFGYSRGGKNCVSPAAAAAVAARVNSENAAGQRGLAPGGTTSETFFSVAGIPDDSRNVDAVSSSNSGNDSDEDDSSSEASEHDFDWDEQQQHSQHEPLDHRELVRFLETLQSVRFDELPLAAVPLSMRARAELRPFQLQALYWLLSREQHEPQRVREADLLNDGSDSMDSWCTCPEKGNDFGCLTKEATLSCADSRGWRPSSDDAAVDSPTSPLTSKGVSNTVRGGVFADFMGLGKTRTLIALCEASRAPRTDRVTGSLVESTATLIVCPTSLLTQWVEEIQRCVERPASAPLRILVYYGARKRRQTLFQVAQSYDYVITTYQTLTHEQPPLAFSLMSSGSGDGRPGSLYDSPGSNMSGRTFFGSDLYEYVDELSSNDADSYSVDHHLKTEVGKLFMIRWARIILDEAHYIRNMRTRQSRSCLRLAGVCRWVVTATPVQNSLNDLYPLLRFLAVPHFSSLQWWNEEIVRYFNLDPRHPRPVTALSILFRSILLRRTPESLVNGKPILDLPPKRLVTRTVALSRDEARFYKAIHTKATEKLNALRQRDAVATQSPLATFTTAFEMLVRCRQTCLHPYIVVAALRKCCHLSNGVGGGERPGESQRRQGGAADASGPVNSSSRSGNDAALRQAQCDQQQQLQMQQQRQREAEQQTARALDQFIHSVVLRRLRTVKASEFVQSLVQEIRQQRLELRECIICLDTVNRPAILPCAHVFCVECITHALEATRRCPLCKRTSRVSELLLVPMELLNTEQHPAADAGGSGGAGASPSAHVKGEDGRAVAEPPPEVPEGLDLTNVANWGLTLSSKTQFLLHAIARIPPEDKAVVFSSFLTYLRYAQHWLQESGVSCALYSGGMTMRQKQLLLDKFRDTTQPDSPRVLLATMSSCGVGLNLTCANHCFLMEPSWNPGTEEQALNRIHRIGQTKPVTVTKLIADDTIEQSICELCERKRALSGYCFGNGSSISGGGGGDGRLRTADLLALFAPETSSSEDSNDSDEEDESD